jgi:uncharacterized protein
MSRPHKPRIVCQAPMASYFKPRGIPLPFLEEVVLGLDEVEALRLADLEGLEQEDVGKRMGVSRGTVGRLLARAHRTVADALLRGKALRLEGGPVAPPPVCAARVRDGGRHVARGGLSERARPQSRRAAVLGRQREAPNASGRRRRRREERAVARSLSREPTLRRKRTSLPLIQAGLDRRIRARAPRWPCLRCNGMARSRWDRIREARSACSACALRLRP